jgi:VWFA-related protein
MLIRPSGFIRRVLVLCLGAVGIAIAQQPTQQPAQQPATPSAETQTVSVKSNEVLLDALFRDKKGKMIRDVRQEEVEIYEDGVKQQITSFRLIGPGEAEAAKPATPDPMRPLSLATIVFDRIDQGRIQRARESALAFIDNALQDNVYARVCVIGRRLYLVEQFTNDRTRLRKAIDRALAPSEKGIAENSDRLVQQLEAVSAEKGESEATLARLSGETIKGADKSLHDAKSTSPVFPLLHLSRAQNRLPGRKLVIYFSNGLYLNPGLTDVFNAAISEANRANVAFYALDTRILLASIGVGSSRLESETVINATRRPESAVYSDARADSFNSFRSQASSNFNMFDVMRRRAELNKQTALTELAEQTGGSMITAANDINGMLRRATSELGNYYLISYTSTNQEYDGKFRKIEVKVARNGISAQTRNGYFATPPTSKRPTIAYEAALLSALNGAVVPRDFSLRASALRFEAREKEAHYAATLETSLADFIHEEDKAKQIYPVDIALLLMIKDEKGEIVQTFSERHPLEIPSAQIADARKMNITLSRDFWLPPGRYLLEVAAHDRSTERLSAERRSFIVAPPTNGLQLGSLYLVKQVEQVEERPADEADNPLYAGRVKILPETASELSLDGRNDFSFHLAIYPNAKISAVPKLKIELWHNEKVIASTTPELPKADDKGRITFTASIPAKGLVAGSYELRAQGTQGDATATETLAFKLTGGPLATATPINDEKVIESKLAATDRMRELTLTAIDTAKPIEIAVDGLLNEMEAVGAQMFRRLGEYTYSLRKVRRTLDKKGRIRTEDYNDYEAYPVRGLHALVQLSVNGNRLSVDRIGVDRRQATDILIEEETREKAADKPLSFWGARIGGYLPGNKYVSILIDPEIFFSTCEFSSPRTVSLDGRETLVLDFQARQKEKLTPEKDWIRGLRGHIWIDAAEKALVRIEAQNPDVVQQEGQTSPHFVYQQQRLAAGIWSPQLIRINSTGDERLFRGLNWDAWFEFTSFRKFDASQSDVKLNSPSEKQKQDH